MSKTSGQAVDTPVASKRDAGAPFADVFTLMREAFSEAVVERALHFRTKVSKRVQSALETALRADVKVRGFRDASKATAEKLVGPVLMEIERGNGRLAGAMLRVWDESHGPLRARVTEHLRKEAIAPAKPDYKANRFTATWLVDEWVQHREAVAKENHEFNEDEVALMLCLVAGRAPVPELREALTRIDSQLFRGWILELLELPPEAPPWSDVDAFLSATSQIATTKAKEKVESQTDALRAALEALQGTYKDEAKYLGLDMRFWFTEVKTRLDLVPELLDVLRGLARELEAYRPIRPQGASLDEERRRAKERGEREAAIIGLAKDWETVTAKPAKPVAQVAEQRAAYKVSPAGSMQAEFRKLEEDYEDLARRRHQVMVKEKDEANSARQLERTQLKETIANLEQELDQWRQAYKDDAEAAGDNPEGTAAEAEEADAPSSLVDAIERAKKQFDGELLFALNGKSRTNIPFQKPQEVFDAFAWLATEFRQRRPSPGTSPDFNLSIKKACPGWFYKPNQTQTTMGMYRDWYRTDLQGKTYELSNHIGKGASFDPRSTIRIAFAWDEEKSQVVVGFVGPHQRNRQS